MVVWRSKAENPWLHQAEQTVERFVTEPEDSDEPTCGPGPFAMANADTTSGMLVSAGFEDISLRRCDLPYRMGADMDEAVAVVTGIGPGGRGDPARRRRGRRAAASDRGGAARGPGPVRDAQGVIASASTWIVTATA